LLFVNFYHLCCSILFNFSPNFFLYFMQRLSLLSVLSVFALFLFSCAGKENATLNGDPNPISQDILSRIASLGFSTDGVLAEDGGYIVENDIFLSAEDLDAAEVHQHLVIAQNEQYRTTNTVTGLPRLINVSIDAARFPASYVTALDAAIARYNAQGLQLTFQRVSSGANIAIVRGSGNYLASAGFPTSSGNPYSQIKLNSSAIGSGTSSTFINYLATIIAHEVGHCIGFRHTDYMNRAYSCGGSAYNEGASTVGAIHIPGTPTGPDAGSWMLACIGANQNRPFNNNDVTALNFLY
jgi:Dual-action HEIGH metallo-peptidase